MNKKTSKKVVLLILDGWGIGKDDKFNAIANAKTPNFKKLIIDYPNVNLKSDGLSVGLPEGQYGTSEINHQVIGAGRVIYQDLPKINKAIEDKSFYSNKVFLDAIEHTNKNNSKLHLVGVISDGKVHASLDHVVELIRLAKQKKVKKLFVHAFVDGRDSPPKSAEKYLKVIEKELEEGFEEASIADMQGRFYLDRDRDWEKTEMAFQLMRKGEGMHVKDYISGINLSYNQNETDEFMRQYWIDKNGVVEDNDSVIFSSLQIRQNVSDSQKIFR